MDNETILTEKTEIIGVRFRDAGKVYYFAPGQVQVNTGDNVIVETARGMEYGFVAEGNHLVDSSKIVPPLRPVIRAADEKDAERYETNRQLEAEAFAVCKKKIAEHGLDMKLIEAEYTFDNSKLLFYFSAEVRVDFRELVKDLASVFRTRIELRQIGIRDEAKMMGGLGVCGCPFCCSSFLSDFVQVSIKMAKEQNLSLNSAKISGTCGRLMCCLKYEQDAYEDLLKSSPKQDSFVDTPDGRGTITEVELLSCRVKVRMEENPETISLFSNEDIAVLRSGKARKNDPPIPADLAPISGSGQRVRRTEEKEDKPLLEPIRFRYSTESVVEETAAEERNEEQQSAASRPRRRRRSAEEAPQQQAAAPAPQGERRSRRRRRSGKPQGEGQPAQEKND